MKCDICKKESTWLEFVGSDMVCNKCINKNKVMGNVLRTHVNTFRFLIKKMKIENYEDLMKITKKEAWKYADLSVLNKK